MQAAATHHTDPFDFVILGAGVSGLALGRALAGAGRRLRGLILEPRQIRPNPRHWVFPARPGHVLARFEAARLDRFEVQLASGAVLDRRLRRLAVVRVRAEDVQADALEALAAAPRISVLEGVCITAVEPGARLARVETDQGTFSARWVIDTRPRPDTETPAGAAVQASHYAAGPVSVSEGDRLRFTLTAGPEAELIQTVRARRMGQAEQVRFMIAPPAVSLPAGRLAEVMDDLGLDADTVWRGLGVWPMTPQYRARVRGRVLIAPADAYGLRFAPGMAALRLTGWAQAQAGRLSAGRDLTAPPGPSLPARLSARRIARWLRADPAGAAAGLERLLCQAPADTVLRTLSGAPGWLDLLAAAGARRW